jgi:hypothetical protein
MKTALQEVFSELERLHPSLFDIYTQQGREFVNNFHKFLKMEKEQIGKAFLNGRIKEIGQGVLFDLQPLTETFNDYYNETFKSE